LLRDTSTLVSLSPGIEPATFLLPDNRCYLLSSIGLSVQKWPHHLSQSCAILLFNSIANFSILVYLFFYEMLLRFIVVLLGVYT